MNTIIGPRHESPVLTLTVAECVPIMAQAWNEKKLSRLNGGAGCMYRSEQGPCIIGTCLPDDLIDMTSYGHSWDGDNAIMNGKLPNTRSIGRAFTLNLIATDDRDWFDNLQNRYDQGDLDACRTMLRAAGAIIND